MMPGVLRFPSEISILKKEVFNNWYKLRTYYAATLITSTPIHVSYFTNKRPFLLALKFGFSVFCFCFIIATSDHDFGQFTDTVCGRLCDGRLFHNRTATGIRKIFKGCYRLHSSYSCC